MGDQTTCGRGLAENSAVPARLAEVTAALAGVLEAHMAALDLDDDNSRQEHAVYLRLVREQREAAGRLRAVADEMAGQRDLPMGRHDQEAMSSPRVIDAFEHFVDAEQELLRLLEERLEQDRGMLAAIRGAGGRGS